MEKWEHWSSFPRRRGRGGWKWQNRDREWAYLLYRLPSSLLRGNGWRMRTEGKKGLTGAHSLRVRSAPVGRAWSQDHGAASHTSPQIKTGLNAHVHLTFLFFSFCFYSVPDSSAGNDAWAVCSRLSPLKIPPQRPPEACFLDTPQSSQVDNRD